MRETLASLVEDWRRLGSETAVVAHRGNRSYRTSYGELALLAGRFAAELERRGVKPGERVLLWGENSADWIGVFFGCLLRGVLPVPLDAAGAPEFARRIVDETSPSLVVGDGQLIGQLQGDRAAMNLEKLGQALPSQPRFELSEVVTQESPFQIVFTSGTTSEPKGVVHTHRNVLASLRPIENEIDRYRRYERWVHPLRFLHTLPFSHVFGQFMGLWIPALLGAEVHLPAGLDPARYISLSKRERISVLVAVPRALELLRAHLLARYPQLPAELASSAGTSAWKRWWRFRRVHAAFGFKFWAFICGGATLSAELEGFWNALGFALIQGYGMTETAALVTLNHPFKVGKGTLGKALPGREVKLSEEGEILVRGDMLAAGSWTGGRFQPRKEEWLATGDLAQCGAGGDLRFAGRRGDVIVTAAGMNLYPKDLETALLQQPGVRGCVVVGCDGDGGPEPVGVVQFEGDEAAFRTVLVRANALLHTHQQMRRILRWFKPVFPYTATGKLLRREVAAWACAEIAGSGTQKRPEATEDALLRLIEEVSREPSPRADDEARLTEDFHLDSLGRVQLQSLLEERFGISVPDERMAGMQTLGELRTQTGQARQLIVGRDGVVKDDASRFVLPSGGSRTVERRALPYPRWPWSRPVRWLRQIFLEAVAMPLVRLLAKPRLEQTVELPEGQPVLIIANHVNTFDVPLVLSALPASRRHRVAVAMSAEVLGDLRYGRGQGSGVLNLLARPAYWLLTALFNVFPLPRLRGFRESFAHAGEALDRGYSVLVFPEGRRGYTGEMQPFRPGIGLLTQASRVPVVPIAIQGAGVPSRAGGGWFRPKGLAVHVGRPVLFAPTAEPQEITDELEAALRALGPS